MEGRLGRVLGKLGIGNKPTPIGMDGYEQMIPGLTEGLKRTYEIEEGPHVEHVLEGITAIPVINPGFRAVEAAIAAGEPVPPIQYIPDTLVVRPDGEIDIADVDGLHDKLRTAIEEVNRGVAARELTPQV